MISTLINRDPAQHRVILVTRLVVELEDGLALDPREIRPATLPLEPQALLEGRRQLDRRLWRVQLARAQRRSGWAHRTLSPWGCRATKSRQKSRAAEAQGAEHCQARGRLSMLPRPLSTVEHRSTLATGLARSEVDATARLRGVPPVAASSASDSHERLALGGAQLG